MKIEFTKKNSLIAVLVAAVLVLLGMQLAGNHNGMSHMGNSSSNTSIKSSEFSSNDVMFAQMMIPHHQQAVEMSDLAISISTNEDVLALARQIKAAQDPEITQMKGWLTAAGASLTMDHDMGMDGMLSDEEIAALSKAQGVEFDKLFLSGMIAHHEGALSMVSMIEDSENDKARKLAAEIKSSQSAEIELMKNFLASL
jgi:uncharacterized protein (DUF305 family)